MASKCPEDVHISQTPAIASPKPKAKRDPNLGPVGFQKETSASSWIPKLVNVYIKRTGKIHHAIFIGKTTISTGPFSVATWKITRGYLMYPTFANAFFVLSDTKLTEKLADLQI